MILRLLWGIPGNNAQPLIMTGTQSVLDTQELLLAYYLHGSHAAPQVSDFYPLCSSTIEHGALSGEGTCQ